MLAGILCSGLASSKLVACVLPNYPTTGQTRSKQHYFWHFARIFFALYFIFCALLGLYFLNKWCVMAYQVPFTETCQHEQLYSCTSPHVSKFRVVYAQETSSSPTTLF